MWKESQSLYTFKLFGCSYVYFKLLLWNLREKIHILLKYQKVIISLSKPSKFLKKVKMLKGNLFLPHEHSPRDNPKKGKKTPLFQMHPFIPSADCRFPFHNLSSVSSTNWTNCPPASGRRSNSVLTEPLLMCISVLYSAVPSCSYSSKVTGQFLTLCLSQGIRTKAHDL